MAAQPCAHLHFFVRAVIIEDHVYDLHAGLELQGLDGIEETDELLMSVTLPYEAADDLAFEHIQSE